jgi:hypothetical protein
MGSVKKILSGKSRENREGSIKMDVSEINSEDGSSSGLCPMAILSSIDGSENSAS